MFKYKGVDCPYCHKEFQPTDDIVICPECGAPYHRECVRESGGCVLTELHEKGEQWTPPEKPADQNVFDGMSHHRCSRCGTQNPPDRLFCEVCGTMLHEPAGESGQTPENWAEEDRSAPPFQMPYNPYTTPFGGLNADETIDDVPVRDLAIYVRENSHFFLPRFKDFFSKKSTLSWSWPAFFLDFYYLMYRKMWGLAAIVLSLSLLLSVPSTLLTLDSMIMTFNEEASVIAALNITPEKMVTLTNFCSFLSMVMKFALASLVHRLYARKVMRDVKKLRAEKGSDPSYTTLLSEKGGTSKLAVILCIAATFAVSMALSVVLTSVMMSIGGF